MAALYQRVRPETFEDMVGNHTHINALEKLLKSQDPPHVFLFVGPPGCGKTTAARIAAEMLGAEGIGIVEINSANNRGIDTARTIQNEMRFHPTMGDLTVYIIDELHMTTREWQNAMLKPLEDTPDHVFFFLCTTDPHKLAKALRSRCHEVVFPAMATEDMMYLLRRVNHEEELGVKKAVIQEIAEVADGSARRGLVLLEKVSTAETQEEQLEIVRGGYVEEDEAEVIELCRALLGGKNWSAIATILKTLKESDSDPERIRYAVLGYMNAVLLGGKSNAKAAVTMEYFSEPFYDSGKAGLTLACYQSMFAGD